MDRHSDVLTSAPHDIGKYDAPGSQECVAQMDHVAGELYRIAALLLGDQNAAVTVVEESLLAVDLHKCRGEAEALLEAQSCVVQQAVARMEQAHPGAFLSAAQPCGECIEPVGMGQEPLDATVAGKEERTGQMQNQMRKWLDALAPAARAVFVLRGLLRYDDGFAADTLSQGLTASKYVWTAGQVRETYRNALCALGTLLAAQPQSA